jgi:hypothetical protein
VFEWGGRATAVRRRQQQGPLSRIAWNIYMHFPFLFEARTILDWTCTSTSLDLFMWFTVEWSYAGFFKNKLVMAVRQEKKAVYTGNRSTLLVSGRNSHLLASVRSLK